ncbi:hypothetical protein OG204_04785 [Streptomyces sp. NBC_01387]|uniref:hypothetical protein n=1 Tax=unclassified Streptomyces TaxID=2593676 RepID=UPI002E2F9333|nr:hypothetical protein [Streptomyces sp. NBC_01267]
MGVLQASSTHNQQGTSEMQVSHTRAAVSAAFDDANLIAHAGLVPVMRLAERCGLPRLVREKVRLTGTKNGAGASADAKVTSIVGGMAAGVEASCPRSPDAEPGMAQDRGPTAGLWNGTVVSHRKRPRQPLSAGEEADNTAYRKGRARVEHATGRMKGLSVGLRNPSVVGHVFSAEDHGRRRGCKVSDRERGQDTEPAPTGDAPWWAGLGPTGGVVLIVSGIGLLLWLILRGGTADDDWSHYYGASKILAIGCVIAGTTLLARRRG